MFLWLRLVLSVNNNQQANSFIVQYMKTQLRQSCWIYFLNGTNCIDSKHRIFFLQSSTIPSPGFHLLCCCRNWPRFCVRSRGWTRHHARVGSPVTPRAARSRTTPWVRGGAFNHGFWRKNVANYQQNYPHLNRYRQLQVNTTFLGEYVALHPRWRHNGRRI